MRTHAPLHPLFPTLLCLILVFAPWVSNSKACTPPPDSCSSTSECTFSGLHHHSVGAATIAIVGGKLVVTNIGSSGNDGVAVDLGTPIEFLWTMELPDPLAVGARLIGRFVGTV